MSTIAGLQDFRKPGPPADTGTFQMPTGVLVFEHVFSGTTYVCAVRTGERGWVLVDYGPDAATVIQSAIGALTVGRTWKETVTVTGDFTLSTALLIPSYTILNLQDAKLTLANDVSEDMIYNMDVAGNTQIEIWGGILDGNKANQAFFDHGVITYPFGRGPRGIVFDTVTDFKIIGTHVYDCYLSGIRIIDECLRGEIIAVTIEDCGTVANSGWGLLIGTGDEDVHVFGGTFRGNQLAGIYFDSDSPRCSVVGASVIANKAWGIIFDDTLEDIAQNCLIALNETAGIWLQGNLTGGNKIRGNIIVGNTGNRGGIYACATQSPYVINNEISGNFIFGNSGADGIWLNQGCYGNTVAGNHVIENAGNGINLKLSHRNTVKGNHVFENDNRGIQLEGCQGNIINDNEVFNNGQASANFYDGIRLVDSDATYCIDNIITDNRCGDTAVAAGDKYQRYGIVTEGHSDHNLIEANNVEGNRTGGMSIVGSHNVIGGNEGYNVVQTLFVHPTGGNGTANLPKGMYGVYSLANAASQVVNTTFRLPEDFVALVDIHPVVIAEATGNLYIRSRVEFASDGEAYNANAADGAWHTEAVTNNQMTELDDVSALLAGVVKSDYIGLRLERDATHASDTVEAVLYVLGWIIEYESTAIIEGS